MVRQSSSISAVRDRFLQEENMDLLLNPNLVKLLWKTNGGRGERRPNLVIFVVWSTLIVGGWVKVARGRRSCLGPAENAYFVFLVLFRRIFSVRSRSVRGTSHQPTFMASCLAINYTYLTCLSGGQVRKFPCVTGRNGDRGKLKLRTASGGVLV